MNLKWIFYSLGFKRTITALLLGFFGSSSIAFDFNTVEYHFNVADVSIALFGAAALFHAYLSGTLAAFRLGTLTSIYAVSLGVISLDSTFRPLVAAMHVGAIWFAGLAVGEMLAIANFVAKPMPAIKVVEKAEVISDNKN